jgi:glutaconyl-CoA decarboxylase subunit alpha
MHGETAAVASLSRRLVREKDAGRPLAPVIEQMNALAKQYAEESRPIYGAKRGFVDEVVRYEDLRRYLVAFAGSAYQNPASICPQHHLMLPRIIRSQIVKGLERPKKK